MNDDHIFVLESNKVGYKVVYCPEGHPTGSEWTGNYMVIADGLKRQEAIEFAKRMRA